MKTKSDVPHYPLVSFQLALEVADAVRQGGGVQSDVQKSIIASHLKSSATSGGFLQRVSTARSYGMIEGRGAYHLSENAREYFFPGSDSQKKRAFLTFLASPPVFGEIIKRFDGNQVPSPPMLANVLHREMNVPESWKERVAGFFIKTANAVGAIDSSGFLRYSATRQMIDAAPSTPSTPNLSKPSGGFTPSEQGQTPSGDVNAWVFSLKGQTVRVETSSGELTPALWAKLNAYVQVLNPTPSRKEESKA